MNMTPFCGNSTFWDTQFTLNSSWPRLTQCFQSTALVYMPSTFLWISSLIYVPYLVSKFTVGRTVNTVLTIAKTTISILLAICTIASTIKEVLTLSPLTTVSSDYYNSFQLSTTAGVVDGAVEMSSFILTAVLVQMERRACVITSGVLFIYWLLVVTCHVVPLYTFIELQIFHKDPLSFSVLVIKIFLVVSQFIVTCLSDLKLYSCNRFTTIKECPEVTASFLSRLTFTWMTRLLVNGYRRPLVADDLWHLNPRDTSEGAVGRFSWAWKHYNRRRGFRQQSSWRLASSSTPTVNANGYHPHFGNGNVNGHVGGHVFHESAPIFGTPRESSRRRQSDEDAPQQPVNRRSKCNLLRVLIKGFGWEVMLSYLCKIVSDVLQLIGPYLLKILIGHIENKQYEPIWLGYVLAAIMLVAFWCQTIFYHQHYHLAMTSGMRMKSALLAAIYKKALCLDTNGQRSSPTGEIVNLMSVDCQRVQDVMSYTWMFWSIPLQICLAVYLLWNTIGLPVLSGVGLLLLLVPFNVIIAYFQQRLQRENLSWKDKRIKLTSEVLGGIKVLKLYAWDESFQKKILSLRDKEVTILTKLAWLNAISITLWTCAPFMVCLASFVTHVLAYPEMILTADMAFVTLAMFSILQFPISFIPELVSLTIQASVSLSRIGRYLCETELDRSHYHRKDMDDCAVRVEKAIFTWDPNTSFRLNGINLIIPQGSFVAVVGNVGCGKSSLLSAILGEMDILKGSVHISGSTAYVPQTAWIQNCTLRENILFGYSYNHKRYKKIVECCALHPDIEMLPGGDETEIGEKGVNLSGGQRQRINIARSLYANSDIYFLDDPLSAVDSRVGKHIFKRVLSEKGILKKKTRIMATNAVHWLPLVDLIVVVQEGRITDCGSYLQLMKRVGNFSQFLLASLKQSQESESEIDEDEEVQQLKRKIWEHVESVTSQSEGNTSGEDFIIYHQNKLHLMSTTNDTFKPQQMTTSTEEIKEPIKTATELASRRTNDRDMSRLTDNESTETGTVKPRVLGLYLQSVGWFSVLVAFVMFTLYQISNALANVWLSQWTGDTDLQSTNTTEDTLKQNHYLIVYGALGAAQILFVFIFACVAALRMASAASSMHTAMLDRVLKAPMSFFDTTPVGRIVNRFSRDVEVLDNQLPQIVFMWVTCIFSVIATLTVITVNTPIFATVIVPLFVAYIIMQILSLFSGNAIYV